MSHGPGAGNGAPGTDVCVVGGGPAGLSLALLLARSGVTVTVVERSRSFDRDYRGEILQPGGQAVLDEMGVLDGARRRGAYPLSRFQLLEAGRPVLDIDYGALPGPHNRLLSLPQRHLLEELVEAGQRYPGFTHLPGTRVSGLITDDGRVCGVRCGDRRLYARWVVAADGRYSKVRSLAGIRQDRLDVFGLDVLWLRLPVRGTPPDAVRIHRANGNPVLAYHSYPDSLQIGWTLPHKGFATVTEHGVDAVKRQISAVLPDYADVVDAHVRTFRDLTLLDVFAARAQEWVRDGLVLIGDAAHTHSPLGAQGINLAVADAAVLHPLLVAAVGDGDTRAGALRQYVTTRGPEIDAVMRMQVLQSRGMLSTGRVGATVRPLVARVVQRTPLQKKITRRIAYGSRGVHVRTDLFARTG